MSTWVSGISAITLFVEDLDSSKEFYERAFGLPLHWGDGQSAVYNFENTLINLLQIDQAPDLIGPATVASRDAGARVQFTLTVDDVDAVCTDLQSRGVVLLNGPIDRPWGIRTASFQDPAGHIWEIAH
jgi:catechol 2,3-dioxygenase-like lactoylglutathione lyase family enzyme